MPKTKLEKYIVTYQSQEHFEVLGHVTAEDIEGAIKIAKEELNKEAKVYDVEEATIAKIVDERPIFFDIK